MVMACMHKGTATTPLNASILQAWYNNTHLIIRLAGQSYPVENGLVHCLLLTCSQDRNAVL